MNEPTLLTDSVPVSLRYCFHNQYSYIALLIGIQPMKQIALWAFDKMCMGKIAQGKLKKEMRIMFSFRVTFQFNSTQQHYNTNCQVTHFLLLHFIAIFIIFCCTAPFPVMSQLSNSINKNSLCQMYCKKMTNLLSSFGILLALELKLMS